MLKRMQLCRMHHNEEEFRADFPSTEKREASFPLHEKSDYSIIIRAHNNGWYNYILGKYSGEKGN